MTVKIDGNTTDEVYLDRKLIHITSKLAVGLGHTFTYLRFIEEVIGGNITILKADFNDRKHIVTGLFIWQSM